MASKAPIEPVRLVEAEGTGDRFLIYSSERGPEVRLRYDGDQLWATQRQMADIFGVNVPSVSRHLKNIFAEGELDASSTVSESETVAVEGSRKVRRTIVLYSLDAIISVGYRVNSRQGTLFRRWATDKLVQFATKGFVIDVERLKEPEARDHFQDLLEKIRDIRSSEKRMWTRVLELAAFCSDYSDRDKTAAKAFFATMQNTLYWAVTQQTAAEVVFERVDARKDNFGLTSFQGGMPTIAEAQVAKNFYGEGEIRALNLMTSMVLDFFESQAEQQRLTTLDHFLSKMRELIRVDGRPLLGQDNRGARSKAQADAKATAEMSKYRTRIRKEKETAGEAAVRELLRGARAVSKSNKKGSR